VAANDREVHEYFYSRPDTPPEVAALAYAGYAEAKYDWAAHFEGREGRSPTAQEVDRWIADLPNSRLDGLRDAAVSLFDLAARAYLAADMDEVARAARDEAIVRQVSAIEGRVRKATSFWRTLLPNLVVGVFASLIFSVLIIVAAMIFAKDPSPFALLRSLQPPPASPASH
jgi:hypothetical protein